MRARIEGLPSGPAFCDVDEADGQPPAEVMIKPLVLACWGTGSRDELRLPLLRIEADTAVYGPPA
jgi:hypothetical protein